MANQAPARRNPRTSEVVNAARQDYYNKILQLDSHFSDVLEGGASPGLADAFKAAKLQSTDAKHQFKAPDLKAELKKIPGLTDEQLKLDQAGVDALPEANAKEKRIKNALQMNLAMQALAAEVAQMQAAKLWQMQITNGELLQDDKSIGLSGNGAHITVDDLDRLSNQTEHLKVFDEGQFGSKIKVIREGGSRRFIFNGRPTAADITAIVDTIAQSGGSKVTIDCENPSELSAYKFMAEQSIAHIFNAGLNMKVQANVPHFVAKPLGGINSKGEPVGVTSSTRKAFLDGRASHDLYVAVSNAMPQGDAVASNPPLRMAQTYENLTDVMHRRRFLKMAVHNMQDNFQAMVAEIAKTGSLKLMQELYDDFQTIRDSNDWDIQKIYHQVMGSQPESKEANRLVLNAYGRKEGALNNLTTKQACKMLDNLFDSTKASRHQFQVNFERGMDPTAIANTAISNLSEMQLQAYAKHLAGLSANMQSAERAGMVMTGIKNPQQRKAFMQAYLHERHQLHMAGKGFDDSMFPDDVDDYKRNCSAVLDEVRGDAADILRGTREYCLRSGQPNAAPLQETRNSIEEGYRDLVGDVAKNMRDHYVADFTAADSQQFVDQACDVINDEASMKHFATQQEEFAHTHTPEPHIRAGI